MFEWISIIGLILFLAVSLLTILAVLAVAGIFITLVVAALLYVPAVSR